MKLLGYDPQPFGMSILVCLFWYVYFGVSRCRCCFVLLCIRLGLLKCLDKYGSVEMSIIFVIVIILCTFQPRRTRCRPRKESRGRRGGRTGRGRARGRRRWPRNHAWPSTFRLNAPSSSTPSNSCATKREKISTVVDTSCTSWKVD